MTPQTDAAASRVTYGLGDRVSIGGLTEGVIVQSEHGYREYPESEPTDLYLVEYRLWPNEPTRSQWSRAERLTLIEAAEPLAQRRVA